MDRNDKINAKKGEERPVLEITMIKLHNQLWYVVQVHNEIKRKW